MNDVTRLKAALAALPDGFAITASLRRVLSICDEMAVVNWQDLQNQLGADVTFDGTSEFLTIRRRAGIEGWTPQNLAPLLEPHRIAS
jgi:hypothetical protein